MSESRAPTRRWLIEAAVIIGSILAAFSIDAWWDERRDTEAREALYDAYTSDIASMRIELDRVRAFHSDGLSAVRALLSLREGPPLGPDDAERVDSVFSVAMYGSTFDAPAGAARTIVSSSDLSYLRNPELIAASNQLLAQIESLDREQVELGVELNGTSKVLTDLGVDMADIWDFGGQGLESPWARQPTTAWSVATGVEVRSALAELYWQYRNTVQILGDIESLLDRIESAMDVRG